MAHERDTVWADFLAKTAFLPIDLSDIAQDVATHVWRALSEAERAAVGAVSDVFRDTTDHYPSATERCLARCSDTECLALAHLVAGLLETTERRVRSAQAALASLEAAWRPEWGPRRSP